MADWRALMGVIISVALIIAAVDAQPVPTDCSDELANLTPCVKYISGGGDVKDPSQACCSALASIVKTNATCLCQVFSGDNSSGVNQTQVLQLPRACNVSSPPASQCAAEFGLARRGII
ncbi:non-specific lipid transfer protein GPI-anchored 5 isoform X2 [Cryptomeria japonica]|uniref:non-specific lipid transfer protein GPI-anchored 5 isoform X2 n=1 Tax=Cryptomeria japonica TaxID=3369 RepID=UPI0025AD4251|nr:non-specific lipid transfer protein GPI-anchored 5 isoform X2 [Cryptomeria japonica]